MKVVYANQPLPKSWDKSIFLAGPTPRDSAVSSWRPEALQLLSDLGYDGVVFVPEDEHGKWQHSYISQVEWEETCLSACDCAVFWIPRDLETLPAFTTNIELGVWLDSGKAVVGFPDTAPKTKYINHYANKLHIPKAKTLRDTLSLALEFLGEGVTRSAGLRKIPLYIYKTPHFQSWLAAQEGAGNKINDARVVWNFRVGEHRKYPLFWAIHVDIFVSQEGRNKSNEIVISRPDISSILAYSPSSVPGNIEICLVREFRSPASTSDGFIWELPGGSSPKPSQDTHQVAAEEFAEETGLILEKERFLTSELPPKQLAGTLSAHKSHLFTAQLSLEEVAYLHSQKGVIHGDESSSERTYVEMVRVADLLSGAIPCDWSTLGMILSNLPVY